MEPLFSKAASLLINSTFICEYSHRDVFSYLSDTFNQEPIQQWLSIINRKLCCTHDNKVFYMGFTDAEDPENKKIIRREFDQVVNGLEVIVKWLELVSSSLGVGRPIMAGDLIAESELMRNIEQSPAQLSRLRKLEKSSFIGSNSTDTRNMIKQVMLRLTEKGYFTQEGGSGTQYRATGKWSWLYVVLEFIASNEGIQSDDDSQQDLLA